MIKEYSDSNLFIKENEEYLNTNKYLSAFFFFDAKLIKAVSKKDFMFKVVNNEKTMLAMKLEPYNLLLFGDKECLGELLEYLNTNNYEFDGLLCSCDNGDELIKISKSIINREYYEDMAMDFMETKEYTSPSSNDVEIASLDDLDTIYEYHCNFFRDCGLSDKADINKIKDSINTFRLIKEDGIIKSIVRVVNYTDESMKISAVYTKPEYRGMGYARKLVNYAKNEIIAQGKIATLNVDKKNPISNHLYSSLGFKKVFSQGIYKQK